MFYEFSSNKIANKEEWPLIWCVETKLAGFLIEYKNELKSLSMSSLKDAAISYLIKSEEEISYWFGEMISQEFIDSYFEFEIPYWKDYLASILEDDVPQIRIDLLLTCYQQSPSFKKFVQELNLRIKASPSPRPPSGGVDRH